MTTTSNYKVYAFLSNDNKPAEKVLIHNIKTPYDIVIRDAIEGKFRLYTGDIKQNIKDIKNEIKTKNRDLHQIQLNDSPMRFCFDIDFTNNSMKIQPIIDSITKAMKDCGYDDFEIVAIVERRYYDYKRYKLYSNLYFKYLSMLQMTFMRLKSHIEDPAIIGVIDNIYNRYSSLQMAGCYKDGKKGHIIKGTFEDTLLNQYTGHNQILEENNHSFKEQQGVEWTPTTKEEMDFKQVIINDDDFIRGEFKIVNTTARIKKGRRGKPSLCSICGRTHNKENMVYELRYDKTIWKRCYRNKNEMVKIGKIGSNNEAMRKAIKNIIDRGHRDNYNNELIKSLRPTDTHEIIDEKELKDYPDGKNTLIIKSGTGTGKTKSFIRAIKRWKITDKKTRSLILGARRTFCTDIHNKFNATIDGVYYECYLEHSKLKIFSFQHLILQMESLYKYDKKHGAPDILMLDEIESLIEQLLSPTMNEHYHNNIKTLEWLIKYSHKIVAMDAYLRPRTINYIKSLREDPIHLIINKFKSRERFTHYITMNQNEGKRIMMEKLKNEQANIVIPFTGEADKAEALKQQIIKNTDIKSEEILLITSNTDSNEKTAIFKNISKMIPNIRVFIYTPSLTAGVSIELSHFHYLFGYYTTSTANIQACLQMVGRVRELKNNILYSCINTAYIGYNAVDNMTMAEAMIKYYLKKGTNNPIGRAVDFEYLENGEVEIINKKPSYYLNLETVINNNKSKSLFGMMLCDLEIEAGVNVVLLDKNEDEEENKIMTNIKGEAEDILKEIKNIKYTEITQAEDITEKEYNILKAEEKQPLGLTKEDKLKKAKTSFRRIYGIPCGFELKSDDMMKYSKPNNYNVYKSLQAIKRYDNVDESLKAIKINHMLSRQDTIIRKMADNNLYYMNHYYRINIMKMFNIEHILNSKDTILDTKDKTITRRDIINGAVKVGQWMESIKIKDCKRNNTGYYVVCNQLEIRKRDHIKKQHWSPSVNVRKWLGFIRAVFEEHYGFYLMSHYTGGAKRKATDNDLFCFVNKADLLFINTIKPDEPFKRETINYNEKINQDELKPYLFHEWIGEDGTIEKSARFHDYLENDEPYEEEPELEMIYGDDD